LSLAPAQCTAAQIKRLALGEVNRLVFVRLYRFSPKLLDALKIVQRETVVR